MWTDKDGKTWYKGNLHLHTTISDGVRTPEEAFALYKANKYDFVARTDHWHASESGSFDGMLLLPGCEYDVGKVSEDGMYHILGIGCPQIAEKTNRPSAQEIIDRIHAAGGVAVLAHPAWSLNTPEQILRLRDVDLTEIFNSVSDLPRNCRPYSGLILDMAAVAGRLLPLAATDDVHFYIPGDTCRSFIMLQADALTEEAVLEALRAGRYYATQGPVLDARREGNEIVVDCSPAESVVFFTDKVWERRRAIVGENITHAAFELKDQAFVRVEIRDKEGRFAWSQYFDLKDRPQ